MSSNSDGYDLFIAALWLVLLVCLIVVVVFAGLFVLIVTPILIGGLWWFQRWRRRVRHEQQVAETVALHREVNALCSEFEAIDPEALSERVWDLLQRVRARHGLDENQSTDLDIFVARTFSRLFFVWSIPDVPALPDDLSEDSGLRLRVELKKIKKYIGDPGKSREQFIGSILDALHSVLDALPRSALLPPSDDSFIALPQPVWSLIDDVPAVVQASMHALMPVNASYPNIGLPIQNQLYSNTCLMSGADPSQITDIITDRRQPTLKNYVHPTDSKRDPEEVVEGYLADTPLRDLFAFSVPLAIPQNVRFEHQWIVAPPGIGKSTALQYLIERDLALVARNEASVIVMDSKRDLYRAIVGLKRFAPGGDLDGKLVAIDTEDVDWPLALNILDIGLHREEEGARGAYAREALYNAAISMLDYIFRALLGAELTSRQSTLFNFTVELLVRLPEPTLDTLLELMQTSPKEFPEMYGDYVAELGQDAQRFFATKFNDTRVNETKAQVADRIFAIKRNRTLARMFSAPRSKLNLFQEMSNAKVILINYPKDLLQEEGCEIFSRFMLANILMAAQKRQLLEQARRLPTFLYIDEAQDVIRRDERIPVFLDQARGFRVGCILAHQRLDQLDTRVFNALLGSTAIKFAAHVSETTTPMLARNMATDADFINRQPAWSFAVNVRRYTERALSYQVPEVDMETMARMTPAEADALRAVMRERFAYRTSDGAPPPPMSGPPVPPPARREDDDIDRAAEWNPAD